MIHRPISGTCEDGYAPVRRAFEENFTAREEIGAGLCVYHRGRCVVDLWGGEADVERHVPWQRDTRLVMFSVTKGLAAMALALLADRGKLDWDAPVASVWPGFAQAGKAAITFRTLFNHRAGLIAIDEPFSMDDCTRPERWPALVQRMERQRPLWEPGENQGYHAVTYGLYAREVFERIAGEPMGVFLRRELFEPLGAEVSLGTDASLDRTIATLYPPPDGVRVARMLVAAARGGTNESRIARASLSRSSYPLRAFRSPTLGGKGARAYNEPPARRAELPWASATGSAHGLARAYLPFASGGETGGRRYLKAATIEPVYRRQGWSSNDLVLNKPIGWSQGFLKEETTVFSPRRESFGHAGMGGALGWCDPVNELTFGYVMNRMDLAVRSPRTLALCRALYACDAVRG